MTDVRAELQAALGEEYLLQRELGGGGKSPAFVATEAASGQAVVVKVVAPDHAGAPGSELFADRFAREVKFAARLRQRNIVPLLSAGAAGRIAYYIMPLVEGRSLRDRLASGDPVSLDEATHILHDVAGALAYAHDQSVVHRDIRPEHILLSSGTAAVTDFGIAKAIAASRTIEISTETPTSVSGTFTSAGGAAGPPAYLSPEQAAGGMTDARSDLYAWGVVAYELLAGAHPFAECTTSPAMIAAHLTERPTPLAERCPTVPAGLADLVMRCLEKDADARPSSAAVLLAALDGAPVAESAPSPSPTSPTSPTGRDLAIITDEEPSGSFARPMAVSAMLLLLALFLWGWFSRQAATP